VIVFKGNTTLLRNRASWKGAGAYGGVAGARQCVRAYDVCVFCTCAVGCADGCVRSTVFVLNNLDSWYQP
jgi:hypothetical protein